MTNALPGVLGKIASVAGEAAAVAISARRGGTRVYIPSKVTNRHWLVDTVGREAAKKVCKLLARQKVEIPLSIGGAYRTLNRAVAKHVHQLIKDGASEAEIARAVGITGRTVRRHRRAHRGQGKDPRQQSLF